MTTTKSTTELLAFAKDFYAKDSTKTASILNYAIKKTFGEDTSDNVYFNMQIDKKYAQFKFKNAIVSSGIKMPFGYKPDVSGSGPIPKNNLILMFRKITKDDIKGGDYVPRVMATEAEQVEENARVDRILDNYVESTNELVDVFTLIEQDFKTRLAPQLIKDAETDSSKAKLLKVIKAIKRKSEGTVKLNAFIQSSYVDKETDEQVEMESPLARVKVPLAKDGVMGYYAKGVHIPVIYNAKISAMLRMTTLILANIKKLEQQLKDIVQYPDQVAIHDAIDANRKQYEDLLVSTLKNISCDAEPLGGDIKRLEQIRSELLSLPDPNNIPYFLNVNKSGKPEGTINYQNVIEVISHKSLMSGIIKIDLNASVFGLSCSVAANKLYVSTHSKSVGDKSFTDEEIDEMSMSTGIGQITTAVAAIKIKEDDKKEKEDPKNDDESDDIMSTPVPAAPKPKRKTTKY